MPKVYRWGLFAGGKKAGELKVLAPNPAHALQQARGVLRSALKNIEEGFYDASGLFHPIRSSSDYSRARAGEGRARSKVARRTRGRAYSRKARRARRGAIS